MKRKATHNPAKDEWRIGKGVYVCNATSAGFAISNELDAPEHHMK
jgi:hypothetical protein